MTDFKSSDVTRRTVLGAAAAAPMAMTATGSARAAAEASQAPVDVVPALPAKAEFAPMKVTYLDSGSTHPLSLGGQAAIEDYLLQKMQHRDAPPREHGTPVEEHFARLINADPEEVTWVTSTTTGENLVLLALGLPDTRHRLVTDALHFFGSHYTYGQFMDAGMDVVTIPMETDGTIDLDEMAAAINDDTKLVSVSQVSTINGFEHDLKKVCDIAHAHGAYVYADIIHAAGAVPVDVKATGVDFAACASYKWLMGDMGRGFLYVRKELLEMIRRPWFGYYQLASLESHMYPYDTPGTRPMDFGARADTQGYFAMGTSAHIVEAQLGWSLPWLERAGIPRIQEWRQPMVDAVQTELRRRGYEPLTPERSRTSLVAFALKDARSKLRDALDKNDVRITVSQNRFRVSVAVFNDMNDIDRLLETLPKSA